MKAFYSGLLFSLLLLPATAKEQVTHPVLPDTSSDSRSWYGLWPELTKEALNQGYDIPLPFGVSATYINLRRNVEVKSVKAGVNGTLKDVSRFLAVDTENEVQTGLIRLDAFPLPFLNIYAFGGRIDNQSEVDLAITIPGPGGGDISQDIRIFPDLQADIWGAGANLSGGYKNFSPRSTRSFPQPISVEPSVTPSTSGFTRGALATGAKSMATQPPCLLEPLTGILKP